MSRAWRSHWMHAALAALVTAIVHTWPLASSPASLSLNYNGDVQLNEWIVAWVQRQLFRDPLHLFDANIFHPAPDALAFSEPLIVPALLGYPVRLLGGSPVLVHNLLLIAGFTLTMLAGYALVQQWTGDRLAGVLGATAWTFNTQSLVRLEHLQATHAYGIPLALLAADRLILTGERRHALWLAGWMIVMAYSSGYLVIFTTVAIAILLLVRLPEWRSRIVQVATGMLAAVVASALVVLPLYLPYRRVATEQGMQRPLESVAQFSATIDGYLASYGRLHHWLWNAGAPREFPDAFFPGITVTVLALMALAWSFSAGSDRTRRGRVLACAAIALVAAVLSLGTRTPVYGWLYYWFPPLAALRAAARFGVLWMLATGVLAGIGLAIARSRLRRGPSLLAGALLILLVNVEAIRAPFTFERFRGIPRVYELLEHDPGPVVLVEVPFYPPDVIYMNAEYVFNSTAHWRPLMNGYSGYTPATYRELVEDFGRFPEARAVQAMRAAGATHVMVHPNRFHAEAGDTMRQALANPSLERIAVGRENITLFRIK